MYQGQGVPLVVSVTHLLGRGGLGFFVGVGSLSKLSVLLDCVVWLCLDAALQWQKRNGEK